MMMNDVFSVSFEMPAPVLKQSQATDNLIIVDLLPSELIDYMEEPDRLWIVELFSVLKTPMNLVLQVSNIDLAWELK